MVQDECTSNIFLQAATDDPRRTPVVDLLVLFQEDLHCTTNIDY